MRTGREGIYEHREEKRVDVSEGKELTTSGGNNSERDTVRDTFQDPEVVT